MLIKVLPALSLNLQVILAGHYGVPHDLAYDYEEQETLTTQTVQELDLDLVEQIEEDFLSQYPNNIESLPSEQTSDPIVEGEFEENVEENVKQVTEEQVEGKYAGPPQNAYISLMKDVNVFVAQMIYKYNLSSAVQESNQIVHDDSWVQSLIDAKNDSVLIKEEISEALNPITQELMKAPARGIVDTMSDDFVSLISQTAIAFAKIEGVEAADQNVEVIVQECEPEIQYIPIRVEIEKCTSQSSCLCPDPVININECDIFWDDTDGSGFYKPSESPDYMDPVFNYDYDTNLHDTEFYESFEEVSNDDVDTDFENSDYGDSYWYDEGVWENTDENGNTYTEIDFEQEINEALERLDDYDANMAFFDDEHSVSEQY